MARGLVLSCLAGAVLLSGCDQWGSSFQTAPIKTDNVEGKMRGRRGGGEQVRVWRDPGTGCQYLIWESRRRGGMTPRLTSDGRPMCRAG
jgi:hypothetical protein